MDQNFTGTEGHSMERRRKISVRAGISGYSKIELMIWNERLDFLRIVRSILERLNEWTTVLLEQEVAVQNDNEDSASAASFGKIFERLNE